MKLLFQFFRNSLHLCKLISSDFSYLLWINMPLNFVYEGFSKKKFFIVYTLVELISFHILLNATFSQ